MKLAERMGRLGTETAFEVLAKAKRLEAEGRNIIHLEIGEPDFDTPGNIIEAGTNALKSGYTHYGPSPGLNEARASIAKEIATTRNIPVIGDNVVITPGGKPIMFFAILALVDEGDEVLYPNPGFPIYESMINFVGGVPVPMKLLAERDFAVNVEEVASQITPRTKMMVINSPNNPCGSIVEKDDLEALANLAREHDLVVLSDEIYGEIAFDQEHISALPLDTDERAVIISGMSKAYAMTGFRVGLTRASAAYVDLATKLQEPFISCGVGFAQLAAAEALDGPQDAVREMRDHYKERRDVALDVLHQYDLYRYTPGGAFYLLVDISATGMDSRDFSLQLLEEKKVAVAPGNTFGAMCSDHIRISIASTTENIREGLHRICTMIREKTPQ